MTTNSSLQHKLTKLIEERASQSPSGQIIEASQIIDEIETIDNLVAFSRVKSRIRTSTTKRIWMAFNKVAALFFLPLLIASGWLIYQNAVPSGDRHFSMQEITSPPGVRSRIVLPDGSQVWLNAESTIKFPVPFYRDSRNVEILGEAFFDVTKNPRKPFIVQSGDVSVQVLGTRFNCKAFLQDPTIEVILEEGKIVLHMPEKDDAEGVSMNPGERAVFDKMKGTTTIKRENINKYIAWHDGKMVFDDTPMTEVAQMIARWYGVEVIINDPRIMNYRFTTTFEDESLFQVLELLGLSSPISINYVPATFGKQNQVQTRSKVIINKK